MRTELCGAVFGRECSGCAAFGGHERGLGGYKRGGGGGRKYMF